MEGGQVAGVSVCNYICGSDPVHPLGISVCVHVWKRLLTDEFCRSECKTWREKNDYHGTLALTTIQAALST